MTSDFHDRVIERDNTLVLGFCQAARTSRMELREWAESEIKAVLVQAELQEPLAEGLIKDKVKEVVEQLRTISQTDLPKAVRDYDEVIDEISVGGHTDILDAYDRLEQGTAGLVQIMRKLLQIRSFIGDQG